MAFAAGFSAGYGAVAGAREARRLAEEREEERRRQEEERRRKLGLLEALPETMGSYIGAQEAGRAIEVPIESQAMGLEAGLPPVTRTAQPWASTAEMLRESPQARRAAGKYYQATEKWPWETGGPLESVEVARERTEKRQRQQETRALAVSALDLLESPDDDDKMRGWFLMRRVDAVQGEASKKWVEEGIQGAEERRKAKSWVTKTYAPYWQVRIAQGGKTTAEQDLAFLADTFPVARDVPAIADELKVWSQRFQRDHDPAVRAIGVLGEAKGKGRDPRSALAEAIRREPDGVNQLWTFPEEKLPALMRWAMKGEREERIEQAELETKEAGARKATVEAKRAEEGGAEPRNLAEAHQMLNQVMKSLESVRYADAEDRPTLEAAAKAQIAYLNDWIASHRGGAGAPRPLPSQQTWDQLKKAEAEATTGEGKTRIREQQRLRAERAITKLFGLPPGWDRMNPAERKQAIDELYRRLTPEQKKRVLQELR